MKTSIKYLAVLIFILTLQNCGGIKVLDAWKSPEVSSLKEKSVLVVARTPNEKARIAFERDITDKLISKGIKATPSFSKFPPLAAAKDIDEERKKMIRDILGYEGFEAVIVTSVKDVRERKVTRSNSYYYMDPWNTYFPSYYGNFYGYYYTPYVYSAYVGVSAPTTSTKKTYYLETVAFDLKADENDQLLAVVTTTIENPKDAFKISSKYTDEIFKALEKK